MQGGTGYTWRVSRKHRLGGWLGQTWDTESTDRGPSYRGRPGFLSKSRGLSKVNRQLPAWRRHCH